MRLFKGFKTKTERNQFIKKIGENRVCMCEYAPHASPIDKLIYSNQLDINTYKYIVIYKA